MPGVVRRNHLGMNTVCYEGRLATVARTAASKVEPQAAAARANIVDLNIAPTVASIDRAHSLGGCRTPFASMSDVTANG